MGTRSELLFASENRVGGEGACDFGLNLRMRQQQRQPKDSSSSSLPRKKETMAMPPGGYGGGGGGPLFWNSSNQVTCRSDEYDVVGGGGAITLPRPLNYPSSQFGGEIVGAESASSRVVFTVSQRQELQRQSAIYKYMVASVPVPPELLIPTSISGSPSPSPSMGRGLAELGFSGNKDPEPWRCRRTDGKKWRCSRDVAPEQKYCERHTHKGRFRSRKPVEFHKKTYQKPCSVFGNQSQRQSEDQFCDQSRYLDWLIKGGTNQELHNLYMQPNSKSSLDRDEEKLCFLGQQDEDPLSLRPYTDFILQSTAGEGDLIPNQTQETRHFIDAWSKTERDEIESNSKCSVSSNGKLPFSSLTLSMSGVEDEITQMGLRSDDLKPNWMMMGPVSWTNSPPGGPLAEALCLGIASSARVAPNVAAELHGCSSSTTTNTSKSSD